MTENTEIVAKGSEQGTPTDLNGKLRMPERRPRRLDRSTTLSTTAGLSTASARRIIEEEHVRGVIFPWNKGYKVWWSLTVIGAIMTFFSETYQIAFTTAGLYPYDDDSSIIEYLLLAVFTIDIVINFFLAFRDDEDAVVYDRKSIAKNYLHRMFWIDVLGVFPLYAIALACAGQLGQDNTTTQYLALLGLVKLVRLHRVKKLFDILQYNSKVSLIWLTLVRNVAAALVWSHLSACIFYFIARQSNFDPDNTWIGSEVEGMNAAQRYVVSLYWAIVTFASVGYGDYSPVNPAEKIWGIIYMLLNIIITSWIIGSMTLLIVKQDEKTGLYRSTMQILLQFSSLNNFDRAMHKGLKTQLKLEFKNREVSDEQVLKQFPSAVRRKVLRRLYLPSLLRTNLMQNTRQQFVDAFLAGCTVEIFSPGEELLQRGSICSDLYLLVEGVVALAKTADRTVGERHEGGHGESSIGDSDVVFGTGKGMRMDAGDFINEVGFLTESPQVETVRTKTVCKTLTMSRTTYNSIAEDHPGSVGKVLQNLLAKVEAAVNKSTVQRSSSELSGSLSTSDDGSTDSYSEEVFHTVEGVESATALSAVHDLIKIHMDKQKDDNTTRFLFAAARGDTSLIALMCDQGFDPNGADYDMRTALMVASMKGNTDAVRLLLEYGANPDLVDMHGTSALYEATKNGHDETMEVLLDHDAQLAMSEGLAASTLCQVVYDRDIMTLKRLLKAGIHVNAADYDKRTAVHIAAAEGNVAAMRVLVEHGVDLTVEDRWGNSLHDEAQRSNSTELLEYLETLKAASDGPLLEPQSEGPPLEPPEVG
ncbi:voltage-gated potassium channel [Fragilaria crotonensis]|nr:voltage-gated potassium channel [Fragilaria crotonensis]